MKRVRLGRGVTGTLIDKRVVGEGKYSEEVGGVAECYRKPVGLPGKAEIDARLFLMSVEAVEYGAVARESVGSAACRAYRVGKVYSHRLGSGVVVPPYIGVIQEAIAALAGYVKTDGARRGGSDVV